MSLFYVLIPRAARVLDKRMHNVMTTNSSPVIVAADVPVMMKKLSSRGALEALTTEAAPMSRCDCNSLATLGGLI
ncbi:MAG TPA: hypothetical protein VJX48_06345 [Xanthobacteraceae bacterium]|nr:hypothetical protein [Xanthobacteraceae bacterium]